MKNIKLIYVLIALMATSVLTFSCKSDDDGGEGGSAPSGVITAKVNGTTVTTSEITTMATVTNGTLVIQGNNAAHSPNRAFHITLFGYNGVGSYPLAGNNIMNLAQYIEVYASASDPNNPEVNTWMATSGEVKVSEQTDSYIKGTFNFEAKNVNGSDIKSVTEGSFNISLMIN